MNLKPKRKKNQGALGISSPLEGGAKLRKNIPKV